MNKLPPILKKLSRGRGVLLVAADAIDGAQWLEPGKAGCWSAGEVMAHLADVERGVAGYARRMIAKSVLPVPFYRRLHFPLLLVRSRWIKRQVPAIVTSLTAPTEKEAMLAELQGVRERTLAFLEETRHRDLGAYGWRHPFLGRLDFYGWFAFLAAHEIRHSKQLWEIGQNLRKDVASSRK